MSEHYVFEKLNSEVFEWCGRCEGCRNDSVLDLKTPMLLCGNDVASVVISYLEPWYLANFFVNCGLDFGMKFVYDARGYMWKSEEINMIFSMFSGVILTGLSFSAARNVSFTIRLDKVMFCEVRRCISRVCVLPEQLDEMSSMIELKLIDYNQDSDLSGLCRYKNLRKLTIERIGSVSSPYLWGIYRCERLVSLKLKNIRLISEEIKMISRCQNLVCLEIDGMTDT